LSTPLQTASYQTRISASVLLEFAIHGGLFDQDAKEEIISKNITQ